MKILLIVISLLVAGAAAVALCAVAYAGWRWYKKRAQEEERAFSIS